MITSAKRLPDLVKRCFGQLARQIHRHLPRKRDAGRAPFARHIGHSHIKVFGHAPLDLFDRNGMPSFFLQNVFQQMLDNFLCEFFSAERRKGGDAHERALETTHVRTNAIGDKLENLIPQLDLQRARFFSQDRHPRLDVRRLKLGGKSPFETRNQAVFQIRDLGSGPVAGEHDLLMPVEKRVERVKKFFLGTFFATEKLDIVD